VQSSPVPCYLVPLRPKYLPQHHILKHPQPMFLSVRDRKSSYIIITIIIIYCHSPDILHTSCLERLNNYQYYIHNSVSTFKVPLRRMLAAILCQLLY
jgi:hypothetical protein